MTKKKSSENLGVKMDIFSGKNNLIQKSWSAKKISVPQTRRQVSAAGNGSGNSNSRLISPGRGEQLGKEFTVKLMMMTIIKSQH